MTTRLVYFTIYKDRKGEWRWRAKRGGRIVAESGEGYTRKADLLRAWSHLLDALVMGYWDGKE